jgi:hypothetical protein
MTPRYQPRSSFDTQADFEDAVHAELDAWYESECAKADDECSEGTDDE